MSTFTFENIWGTEHWESPATEFTLTNAGADGLGTEGYVVTESYAVVDLGSDDVAEQGDYLPIDAKIVMTSPDGNRVVTVTLTGTVRYEAGGDNGAISIEGRLDSDADVTILIQETDPDTGEVSEFTITESFDGGDLILTNDNSVGPGDTISNFTYDSELVVCFAEGTHIATLSGEVAVEHLKIGDLVLTADGDSVPVKWMGRQGIAHRFARRERLGLIRIAAGALGENVPTRDLTVTADHGMLLDGVICHASALVNGTSVRRLTRAELPERSTVYHVETADHSVILAEGAASETFVDNVTRQTFDNHADYAALYGDEAEIAPLSLPRALSPRQVPAQIKARLAARCATRASSAA